MLSEASGFVKARPTNKRIKNVFESIQILPILVGDHNAALLGAQSNLLGMAQIQFQCGGDLEWYLASQDQINSLLEKRELPQESSDETVSSLIQWLFEKAICLNTSDIHLELKQDFLRVRFRIDGVLQGHGETFN